MSSADYPPRPPRPPAPPPGPPRPPEYPPPGPPIGPRSSGRPMGGPYMTTFSPHLRCLVSAIGVIPVMVRITADRHARYLLAAALDLEPLS